MWGLRGMWMGVCKVEGKVRVTRNSAPLNVPIAGYNPSSIHPHTDPPTCRSGRSNLLDV